MNERRFLNQFQPQTLVIGTMLCYLDAIFGFLFGMVSTSVVLALLTIAGLAIGGYGIANEKKWGYAVAVGAAVLQVVMLVAVAGADVLGFPLLLNLVFDGALVALLLHPQSRDYQRIWFK
ncbi:MAG TPA: hypothetical protein VIH82_00865 [Acidimicrobiia bacterium]